MSAPMTAEQMTHLDDAATQEAIHRVAGWAAAHYQELPDIADIQFAVRGAIAWRIELIALRARVGELSEDKERLDFMQSSISLAEVYGDGRSKWCVSGMSPGGLGVASDGQPTIRAALDAAREGTQK